jgi:hypothetical protein
VASGQACGQAQRRRLRWRWQQLWPVADRIFGRRLNCADGLQIRRKGANWTIGQRIERRIGRSSGVSDGSAAFCSIGRRITQSGSESSGELDGRAAFRSIGRRIGRSGSKPGGELDGRAANQAANWTVGRSGSESGIAALKVERFLANIS